jgi:hypothetical protein
VDFANAQPAAWPADSKSKNLEIQKGRNFKQLIPLQFFKLFLVLFGTIWKYLTLTGTIWAQSYLIHTSIMPLIE